jgi:hypothetical protein
MIGTIQGYTGISKLYRHQSFEKALIVYHNIWRLKVYIYITKYVREIAFDKSPKYKDQYILTYTQHTKVMVTFKLPSPLCELKVCFKAFYPDIILQFNYPYIFSD